MMKNLSTWGCVEGDVITVELYLSRAINFCFHANTSNGVRQWISWKFSRSGCSHRQQFPRSFAKTRLLNHRPRNWRIPRPFDTDDVIPQPKRPLTVRRPVFPVPVNSPRTGRGREMHRNEPIRTETESIRYWATTVVDYYRVWRGNRSTLVDEWPGH